MPAQANADDKSVRQMIALVEEFRKIDVEMQAQTMLTFLLISGNPDISMKDLAQKSGLASSSISRNVAALSRIHRKGQPGHDLVAAYEDPNDRRSKLVRLTYKGQLVFKNLLERMRG